MKTKNMQLLTILSLLTISSFISKELKAQDHIFTKSISKTINVTNKHIVIESEKANINIEEISGNDMIVNIRFVSKHSDKQTAEKQLNYFNHVINIKSKEVYIRSYILISANEELTGSIHTQYTLKIPKDKNINITNSLGDIIIHDIKGDFVIHSKYGKLNLQNMSGKMLINALVGEVIIKNSQLNFKMDAKYLNSYFYACGGDYSIVTNLGAINFSLNPKLTMLDINASGTEINLSNKNCKEYNLSLISQNGSLFLDNCSINKTMFIKSDTRNLNSDKQEFIYSNPSIKETINIKNKFANISLQ